MVHSTQTPCPQLFNYGYDDTENLNWIGIITLDGRYNSQNLVINIILDRKASALQVGTEIVYKYSFMVSYFSG